MGGDNLAYGLLSLAGHLVRQTFLSAPGNLVFRESGSYDFFALAGIRFVNADNFRGFRLFVLSMQEFEEVGLGLFDRCGSVCKVVFFLKVVYGFFCSHLFGDTDCSFVCFPARFRGETFCRVMNAIIQFSGDFSFGVTVVRAHFFIRVDFAVPVIILVVFREIFVVRELSVYIVVLCFLFFHI